MKITSHSEILEIRTISVFSEMFSVYLTFNPGIRGFNILIFRVRENIFLFHFFSFSISFILSFLHKPKDFYFPKIPIFFHLSTFHTLPSLISLHLTVHMANFDLAKEDTSHPLGTFWLVKKISPPLFTIKPLSFIILHLLYKSKTYLNKILYIFILFFTSSRNQLLQTPSPSLKQTLGLHLLLK